MGWQEGWGILCARTGDGSGRRYLAELTRMTPASSAVTQELLDWRPSQPGLLEDLDKGHYFGPAA